MAGNKAAKHLVAGAIEDGKWTGKVTTHLDRIPMTKLENAKLPKIVSVCWTTDLFHDSVPDSFIDAQLKESIRCNAARIEKGAKPHIFLYLTKRFERLVLRVQEAFRFGYLTEHYFGASACSGEELQQAEMAFAHLHTKRWLSCEPLLEDVGYLAKRTNPTFDWAVCGGESSGDAVRLAGARDIRDWCEATKTPFLFKQWGGSNRDQPPTLDGRTHLEVPGGKLVQSSPGGIWYWSKEK
jgi:protein gp37